MTIVTCPETGVRAPVKAYPPTIHIYLNQNLNRMNVGFLVASMVLIRNTSATPGKHWPTDEIDIESDLAVTTVSGNEIIS